MKRWSVKKKKVLAGILAVSMVAGNLSFVEPIPTAAETTDLLARYELLTDVQDTSGNGRHGTIEGNVTFGTGDAAGMILPGNADSRTNYVSLPGEMFAGQENLTISAWINSSVDPENYSALFFGTETQENQVPANYWLFNPCSPEKNFKSVFTNSVNTAYPWTSEVGLNQTNTEGNKGVWTHYTTVITPTSMIGYINGDYIGTADKSRTVTEFGSDLFAYIGRSNYVNDKAFAGSFQDVCISKTALGAEEIRAVMGEAPADNTKKVVVEKAKQELEVSGLSSVTGNLVLPDTAGYNTTVTWDSSDPGTIAPDGTVTVGTEGKSVTLTARIQLGNVSAEKTFTAYVPPAIGELYLHYDFSKAEGVTVPDSSGHGHDGTILGNGYQISGEVLTLPGGMHGSDAAYLEIPKGTFDNQDILSISLWLKNETGAGNYAAMFFGNASNYWLLNPCNPNGYYKSVLTNSVNTNAPYLTEFGISPSDASNGIVGVRTDDQWGLYTTVIQPGSVTAYYNNSLIGTVKVDRKVSELGTELVSYLGKSTYPDIFYKGGIRDVRVYTDVLTKSDVTELYYAGVEKPEEVEKILQKDLEALKLPYDLVMEDLDLPSEGKYGSKITWNCESVYLDGDGTVTLPTAAQGDQSAVLTATLTLGGQRVTKEFPLTVLADTPENWLSYYMQSLTVTPARLTQDISLPVSCGNGTSVRWISSNSAVLTEEGKVTRPAYGSGDAPVNLTAEVTYQGITKTKVFALTVVEEPYGRILTYVREGDTDRTDALHYGCSEDQGNTYQPLHNNQPILYTDQGEKKMGSPVLFRKPDGTYGMIADDNHNSSSVVIYDSDDLISFTNPRYVVLDSIDRNVRNPFCVYDEEREEYGIWYESNDGKAYVVYTKDFVDFSAAEETGYRKAEVSASQLPKGAIECGVFEATKEEYERILRKYSRVINTSITEFEPITVEKGTDRETIVKPSEVTAVYSDGTTKDFGVDWDEGSWSQVDTGKPGTYQVQGTIRQPDYGTVLVEQRADPYVVKAEDGTYYFTASYPVCGNGEDAAGIGYDRIVLRHADTIEGLSDAGEVIIWNQADSAKAFRYIWAPEMHYIGGSWYILFTASRSGNVWDIRPHMLKCVGSDPMNPESWKTADESNLQQVQGLPGDRAFTDFSLDMTYFESAGKSYVAWAEKPGGISKIYLAQIDPGEPWKLISNCMCVSTPDFAWEWSGGTIINEGPAVLKHDGKIHLCFSAAAVDYTYCVGMVTAEEGADLLDINSWTKYPTPLLTSEDFAGEAFEDQCGPGHNSFTYDKDGNPVIVYHARPMNCSNAIDADGKLGWCEYVGQGRDALNDPCRHARAKSLNFAADGIPILNMTPSEELYTNRVTLTIIVTGEEEEPAAFYAQQGAARILPVAAAEIIGITGSAVCTVTEEGIEFIGNSCETVAVAYRKEDHTTAVITVGVYDTENKAYVLDYGLPVDLNAPGEDAFGIQQLEGTDQYTVSRVKRPAENDTNVAVFHGFRRQGSIGDYGMGITGGAASLEYKEGQLLYTPAAFMSEADVFDYEVEVKKNVDTEIVSAGDGVALKGTLTVVPASVVYYEDDFQAVAVTGDVQKEGTSENLLQSNNQNGVYGYDDAYAKNYSEHLILSYDFSRLKSAEHGTEIADGSGYENHGKIVNDGAKVQGDVLTLPGGDAGSRAAYVELPAGLTNNKKALTISMWLKNETGNTNSAAMFIGGDTNRYWLLNPANPDGRLKSVLTTASWGGTAERGISPTRFGMSGWESDDGGVLGPITTDSWALYTTVIDEEGTLTAYYNKEKIAAVATGITLEQLGKDLSAYLGRSAYADPFFKGSIRDLRIYDRALMQEELASLYAEQHDSAKSSTRLTAGQGESRGTMTFTFQGTGFDLVGRSTTDTAGIAVTVQDASGKAVKNSILDTFYANGALYQIPLISVKDLDYGRYTVTVRAMKTSHQALSEEVHTCVYIDGIRIYNPAGVGTGQEKKEVSGSYLLSEYKADMPEIRELLLGSVQFENLNDMLQNSGTVTGEEQEETQAEGSSVSLVTFDQKAGTTVRHGGQTIVENPGREEAGTAAGLEEILKCGPNHEVYIGKGNAIAFRAVPVKGEDGKFLPATLQVEAKKVSGDGKIPAQLTLLSEDRDPQTITLDTFTQMYYEIDLSKCKYYEEDGSCLVILASTGESMVSLTNLKVKGYRLEALHDSDFEKEEAVIARTYTMMRRMFQESQEADADRILPFTDVKSGAWYEESVHYVYEKGIMTGLNEIHFGPEQPLSRGELAVILYRMAGSPKKVYSPRFKDVTEGIFYTDAVMWASSEGIMTGYMEDEAKEMFGPADPVTREQMAVVLYRYAGYMGRDVKSTSDLSGFPDKTQVSAFAKEGVAWAVAEKLLQGDQGKIQPQESISRAACAAMIQRFCDESFYA